MYPRFYLVRNKEAGTTIPWFDWQEKDEVIAEIKEFFGEEKQEILTEIDPTNGDEEREQLLEALLILDGLGSGVGLPELLTEVFLQGFQFARRHPEIKELD